MLDQFDCCCYLKNEGSANDFLWVKCARMLALNSPTELDELEDTLNKIVKNISENPSEAKYRELKTTNKTISSKVLSRKGGVEFLMAVGFFPVTRGDQKLLVLEADSSLEALQMNLEEATLWLR